MTTSQNDEDSLIDTINTLQNKALEHMIKGCLDAIQTTGGTSEGNPFVFFMYHGPYTEAYTEAIEWVRQRADRGQNPFIYSRTDFDDEEDES